MDLSDLHADPQGIAELKQEIRDLRAAASNHRRDLDLFRHVQRLAKVGVWSWSVDRGDIHWSPEVFRIHGRDPELGEPELESLTTLFHPDDVPGFMQAVQTCVHEGTPYHLDLRIIRPGDGAERVIEAFGRRQIDHDQSVTVYGSIIDVTDQRTQTALLEQALRDTAAAQAFAEAQDQAKMRFLAQMSHEIRTPMNGVLGTAELLAATELGPVQAELLEVLRASGESLLVLLNDILDVAKIEADKVRLEHRVFDLHEVLRRIHTLMSSHVDPERLSLGLTLHIDLPRYVWGDESRLQQIIINLVSNAIKFTGDGLVNIRAGYVDGSVVIEVQDTGIGIPADRLERLFLPFEQASRSTRREYGGTGLGLSICRSLAELMGGTIAAESEAGAGSCFSVRLPLPVADQAVDPLPSTEEDPAPGMSLEGHLVLVVEDNAVNRLVIQRMLEGIGVSVMLAADGLEALAALEQHQPAMVLMDVQMPRMDGLEATRRIRERWGPGLPVVALTADVFPTAIRACMEAGMDHHMAKPVRRASLERTLRGVLTALRAAA